MKTFFKLSLLSVVLFVNVANASQRDSQAGGAASVLIGLVRGSIVGGVASLCHNMSIGSDMPPALATVVGGGAVAILVHEAGSQAVSEVAGGSVNRGVSYLTSLATAAAWFGLYYTQKGSKDIKDAEESKKALIYGRR